jgi:chromate transporter
MAEPVSPRRREGHLARLGAQGSDARPRELFRYVTARRHARNRPNKRRARAAASIMGVSHPDHPSTLDLFVAFSKIGLTSFGGGMSGWLMREFVRRRKWVSEEDFLNGFAIAQSMPGINVTNLAIWIGYRLRGLWGAVAGLTGIVVPPAIVIVLIAAAFASIERFPITHMALDGAAAAAIGLSAWMGVVALQRLPRRLAPLAMATATFVAIGILRWPLPLVVVAAVPVSLLLTALQMRRG